MWNRIPAFLLLLCSVIFGSSAVAETLKIGSILILSGESSHYGIEAQRGAQIAIDQINAAGGAGGKKFEIIWEDETGGRAERAVAAYKKLTTVDGVKIILGPSFQDGLEAIAPLAQRDDVFLITPSTPSLSLPNVFSTWVDPKLESEALAEHLGKRFKRAAILGEQQSWVSMVSRQFKKRFSELGGTVVAQEEPLAQATDLKTEVLRVKDSNPDVIFIPSYALFGKYVRALQQQRVELPVFGIEADSSLIEAGGEAAEGVITIGPSAPSTGFDRKFAERFGEKPDIPSFQAYDAVMLLAQAIWDRGDSVADLREYFARFNRFDGASGTITNHKGIIQTSMALFVAKQGKLEKMQDIPASK